MKLEAVMVTDVGIVRDHNEDAAYVDPHQRFFVVADGMGGHAAGEVASAMAVDTVRATLESSTSIVDSFTQRPTDNSRRALVQLLQSAVLAAHQAVYQRGGRESDKAGMGTTLDVVLIAGHEAFVAHVGDSRTYLLRDGKASQLTTDHTVAEVLVIEGKLTVEEALVSPYRTVLVNAIGVAADVGVEMAHLHLHVGDKLLICSDGLHDYFVAEQELFDQLGPVAVEHCGDALAHVVEMAKDRGGHDNITGIVVTIVDLTEAVPTVIEHDQTLPVELAGLGSTWSEDERTENLAPRDVGLMGDSLDGANSKPTGDGTAERSRSSATAQSLQAVGKNRSIAEDRTEPAIDAASVREELARARAIGNQFVNGDDPTLPSIDTAAARMSPDVAGTRAAVTDEVEDATLDRTASPEPDPDA